MDFSLHYGWVQIITVFVRKLSQKKGRFDTSEDQTGITLVLLLEPISLA
jgi:hypothetical protein